MTDDNRKKVEFQLGELRSENPRERANMLRALSEVPSRDREVLAACEALLSDTTITLLSIPYRFGEVRYAAVDAVWASRHALGIADPVVVEDALVECSTNDVLRIAKEVGIPIESPGVEGVLAAMQKLAAAGKVPRKRISLETLEKNL